MPRPVTMGELPVVTPVSQALRKRQQAESNRFLALTESPPPPPPQAPSRGSRGVPDVPQLCHYTPAFSGPGCAESESCGCSPVPVRTEDRAFDEAIREAEEYNERCATQQKRAGSVQGSASPVSEEPNYEPASASSSYEAPSRRGPNDPEQPRSLTNSEIHEPNQRNEVIGSSIIVPPGYAGNAMLMYGDDTSSDDELIMNVQWTDVDIDVVLDSGCSDHVMNVELDAPGYSAGASEASRAGRGFIVGNGERVPNEGEASVNLRVLDERGQTMDFRSVFQSAKVTRPLMSVAKICRNGYTCNFTDQEAKVVDSAGNTVCTFRRDRGIYVSRMKLRAPSPFGGQA